MTLDSIPARFLTIAIIVAVAVVITAVLRLVISRVVRRLAKVSSDGVELAGRRYPAPAAGARRARRLETLRTVLNSTVTVTIGIIALVMVLSELDVDVAPLVASAGVLGVALAFGAQSLVRDVISGIFLLVEDQYGVGDQIDLGTGTVSMASGVVEEVALRTTTVRDDDGRLWYIRNGEILRVANASQGWLHAVVDLRLAPTADLGRAQVLLSELTTELRNEPGLAEAISPLEPELLVLEVSAAAVALQWRVRTAAGSQEQVASRLRRLVAERFPAAGVELAE